MRHLIPTILCLICGEARQPPGPGGYMMDPPHIVRPTVPQYLNDPYYKYEARTYNTILGYSSNGNKLRQSKSHSQSGEPFFPSTSLPLPTNLFDLYNDASDADTDTHPKAVLDAHEYYANLELVDNFGSYLQNRTQLNILSMDYNDSGHQYNALFQVLMALAVSLKHSCTDFEEAYDQAYLPTVEKYYRRALPTAYSAANVIKDSISFGNAHIPKLRKLERELCQKKDQSCAVKFNNKIKSSPLWYMKELETLQALAHLARNFYPYIEEFDQAAETGEMDSYLLNSKDRLKVYVKHMVNTLEHVFDEQIECQ